MSYLYDSSGKIISSLFNNGETNASISTFKKIGIVGDSFASGTVNVNGEQPSYHELSWGQVMGREQGVSVTNFTKAGLSTRTWLTHANGLSKLLNTEQQGLYILALGINDDNLGESYIGTIADINDDYSLNADTFYGNYGKIIAQIKEYAPNAKLVMTTLARQETLKEQINNAIIDLATYFSIQYIVLEDDYYFNTGEFPMSNGHPSIIAHGGMAKAITRLIENNMMLNPSYYLDYADTTENNDN